MRRALYSNTTGDSNTAHGDRALFSNTIGSANTAVGFEALQYNNASNDTATGYQALWYGGGDYNTAAGAYALIYNSGVNNTAIGFFALSNNTTGSDNIALGVHAGSAITGSHNIDIGNNQGVSGESGAIRIGTVGTQVSTFIAGISGTAVVGDAVVVDGNGQLGTAASSQRFKEAIKPLDKASEVILALKPVTFRYKHELDPKGIPQFGLVAEEGEKVNPDLVVRDDKGKPYSVGYEAVNAMLLNEFLKEHRRVEKLEATVAQQRKDFQATVAHLTARLEEQATQIQKVSAQLEMSKPAPQVVNNQ
jgi:hypothetical protein